MCHFTLDWHKSLILAYIRLIYINQKKSLSCLLKYLHTPHKSQVWLTSNKHFSSWPPPTGVKGKLHNPQCYLIDIQSDKDTAF